MILRICLPGTRHEFSSPHGSGAHKVMYLLYKNMLKLKNPDQIIEKVEFNTLPILDEGFSPSVKSIFYDFSKYDIIHNLAARPLYPIRRGNAISLATVHDLRVLTEPEIMGEDLVDLRRRMGTYFVLIKGARSELDSDYIIASSTQTRDEAIRLGFDKKRIFVVSLGTDDRFIHTPITKKRGKQFKVGYLGSFAVRKNVAFAVDAFNMLKRQGIIFEIWGKPSGTDYYNQIVNSAKPNPNIKFKGYAPEEKLVHIYDSFDVCVHPVIYTGFELEIFDAQARGIPVIIYRHAKIPVEVKKYCFEADDEAHMAQIIENLKDNGYNKKRRKEAMKYARSFTWENTAKGTLEVYKKVLER